MHLVQKLILIILIFSFLNKKLLFLKNESNSPPYVIIYPKSIFKSDVDFKILKYKRKWPYM